MYWTGNVFPFSTLQLWQFTFSLSQAESLSLNWWMVETVTRPIDLVIYKSLGSLKTLFYASRMWKGEEVSLQGDSEGESGKKDAGISPGWEEDAFGPCPGALGTWVSAPAKTLCLSRWRNTTAGLQKTMRTCEQGASEQGQVWIPYWKYLLKYLLCIKPQDFCTTLEGYPEFSKRDWWHRSLELDLN